MRDTSAWCIPLERRLRDALRDEPIGLRQLLQIELGLVLAEIVAPGEPASVLPVLLSGYPFRPGHELAVTNGRALLPSLKNPYGWRTLLGLYASVSAALRGFDLDTDGRVATRLDVTVASDRFDVYERTLSNPLPHRRDRIEVAGPGRWRLRTRSGWTSVNIPAPLIEKSIAFTTRRGLGAARSHVPPLDVPWEDLMETARWIDRSEADTLPKGNWERRLRRVQLDVFEPERGAFTPAARLEIRGLLHMVGMVSSGKSTLMDVLAVWAGRKNIRVVLVVGEVVSAVRRTSLFRTLGLKATPILGRSNRRRHAERLHRLQAVGEETTSPLNLGDAAFEFLSTACAVDGLRLDERPFEVGDTPCESFYPGETDGETGAEERAYSCPFFGSCQQHRGTHDLASSPIWVTTPAALVYTQVPAASLAERLRYAEVVYRERDLVIVDEADQVQVQLDLIFSPHESLFGGSQGSWFDDLEERVGRELRASRRRPLTDMEVGRWVNAVDVARAAGNRIYSLLNQERGLRKWIARSHFTEWTLSARLAREWSEVEEEQEDNARTTRLQAIFRAFNERPFGERGLPPDPLVSLAQRCLTDVDIRSTLAQWISTLPDVELDEPRLTQAAGRLELTLLVAILANRLELLIRMWRQVEQPLRLDGNSALFHRPPEDFRPIVPDSPMGNELGFQFLTTEEEGARAPAGELRFFRCMGVGRWLLLHLHELFDADGTSGPNVLLLSGTSWAGDSPGHHVQVPVRALLRAPQEEVDAIAKSRFEFRPFYDPVTNRAIRVSGARTPHERRGALLGILKQLAAPGRLGGGLSRIERELQGLPAGRRRALILVGSYVDALYVVQELCRLQPGWRDRAVALVPDDDENGAGDEFLTTLHRGEVERFGRGAPDILVAPLLAVERGHNILNEEQRAGVGVVYLLVRPHPPPNDLSFPILSMNRWAVEHGVPTPSGGRVAEAGEKFRREAFRRWRGLLASRRTWPGLDPETRAALTWNQLVSLWQVIGRLVRGGEPARVYFVDAAFAPDSAHDSERGDTEQTSLLLSIGAVLEPYFSDAPLDASDREIARALYGPLRAALKRMYGVNDHADL